MHDNQITVTILVHRKNGTITPQQQTTFENIVTKDKIAFERISSFLPRLKMILTGPSLKHFSVEPWFQPEQTC